MGSTSSSNAIFTGTSTYSQDFQNLISRATAIASLPINQLNSDKTALTDQATALTGLDAKFKAIQTAIQNISDALSGSAFQADVSDPSKLSVSLSTGAMEGNYAVDVVNAGAYATSMTANDWVTGTGTLRDYWLSYDGKQYALDPADNSVTSVAAAINSQYGDLVRATVVNVGNASTPEYRISLQGVKLGDSKPDLLTGPASATSLQTQQVQGSNTLAASQTAQTWNADPSLTFQLSLAGQTYSLSPADNSAQSVADAINSQYGTQVTASVIDLDPNGVHDYRVSLVATAPGDLQPDILASDGVNPPVSLQQQTATGSDTVAVSQTTSDWSTDTGAPLSYQLSLGGVKYSITPADNTAAGLVAAINSQQGDKVTATLSGNRITLTAKQPGDLAPDLIVNQTSLQQQQTTGALAGYIVNNSGKTVTSDTRTISIATGINITLLDKDNGTPVSIAVTRPTSALSTALQSFVDAYNAAVDELGKQYGANNGALAGQSVVRTLSQTLSGLATYSASGGGVSNLPDLGLELDKTGHLSFNQFKLIGADFTNSSAVTAFLGSADSGFIKLATDAMNGAEDPVNGLLPQTEADVQSQSASIDSHIADIQARVDQMSADMQQQMAAADAAIAAMQQQYSYLSTMFQAMQTADQQYK